MKPCSEFLFKLCFPARTANGAPMDHGDFKTNVNSAQEGYCQIYLPYSIPGVGSLVE